MKICKKCKAEFEGVRCMACKNAYKAIYRAKNREKDNSYNKRYKKENKEKVKEQQKKWYLENKQKIKLTKSIYYEKNKEHLLQKCKEWRKANPKKCVVMTQNRSAKKRENGGRLSSGLAEKLYERQRGKCACCSMPLGTDYQLDHIIPISKGGVNEDFNIQLLRRQCNARKGAMHPVEYMQSKGKLL